MKNEAVPSVYSTFKVIENNEGDWLKIFQNFEKNQYKNAQAIQEMALDNYIEIDKEKYISQNIYFMGSVPNVQDYMKTCDFLCMSSKYEGMPITLLEAMANGLIPIVTPVEGILDLITDNINGIIAHLWR